jgi:hypothetical protein
MPTFDPNTNQVHYVVGANLSLAASYSTNAIPQPGDIVIVDAESFSNAITTGFGDNPDLYLFEVKDNYSANIMSLGAPLTFTASYVKYRGSGTTYIKIDGPTSDSYFNTVVICDSNNQTNALILDADSSATQGVDRLVVVKGYVTVATTCGLNYLQVKYRNNPDRDAIVVLPSTGQGIIQAVQAGGMVDCEREVTQCIQMHGTWEQSINEITELEQAAGLMVYNYDELPNAEINGTLDFNQSQQRKTATVYKYNKAQVKYNEILHNITFMEMGDQTR